MLPRTTENTVTSILKEYLNTFGVTNCRPFGSLETPVGRREVDLFCQNGGSYVIEAKFLERDLLQAVAKIQNDYIRYHKELQIAGGFAILYPHELSKTTDAAEVKALANQLNFKVVMLFLPEDSRRNFRVVEGTLNEIAGTLATQILSPPEYLSPSIEYIIEVLRQSASLLTKGLKQIAGESLEGLFGGSHVFENILEYEEGALPEEELRLASAYLLVNQLLFYHVLSRKSPERFDEIETDKLNSPSDLRSYFSAVLEVNYKTVFSYDVASLIPDSFIAEVKTMVAAIQGISAEKIGSDLLGTIFHDLIPFEIRKKVAAFYTNVLAADLLASLAITDPESTVGDLACGSGGLLVAAYRRKKRLIEMNREFNQSDHNRFVENDLLGVDVMPFAANIAACHLALQTPEYPTDRVQIAIWDSTDLRPGLDIPSLAHLQYVMDDQTSLIPYLEHGKNVDKKGVVSLGEMSAEDVPLHTLDIVIMNPPFTRQERIPAEYKEILSQRFEGYQEYVEGQMSYYAYFLLLADKFLQKDGRMALVVPASILRNLSTQGIRRMLAENYNLDYIVTTTGRSAFSESTSFREILLVARKTKIKPHETKFVFLKRIPRNTTEAVSAADVIRHSNGDESFDRYGTIDRISSVPSSELKDNTDNWFRWIAFFDPQLNTVLNEALSSPALSTMDHIFERFSKRKSKRYHSLRGFELRKGTVQKLILISDKNRAIKKDDIWIVDKIGNSVIHVKHRDTRQSIEIPKQATSLTIRRIANLNVLEPSEELDFIITEGFSGFNEFEKLSMADFDTKTMVKIRRDVKRRLGNLFIARRYNMATPGTCATAFYTEDEVAPTKQFWTLSLDSIASKLSVLVMNSVIGLLQILAYRAETEGSFLEVAGYVVPTLRTLDPDKLDENILEDLLAVFQEVRRETLPSILHQLKDRSPTRRKIDRIVLRALGMDNSDEFLDLLYLHLAREIETLRGLTG